MTTALRISIAVAGAPLPVRSSGSAHVPSQQVIRCDSVEHDSEQVLELATRGLLGPGADVVGLVDSVVNDAVKKAARSSASDGSASLKSMRKGVTASDAAPKSAVREASTSEPPRLRFDPDDSSHDAWYHMPDPPLKYSVPSVDEELTLPTARSSRASKGKAVMREEPTWRRKQLNRPLDESSAPRAGTTMAKSASFGPSLKRKLKVLDELLPPTSKRRVLRIDDEQSRKAKVSLTGGPPSVCDRNDARHH